MVEAPPPSTGRFLAPKEKIGDTTWYAQYLFDSVKDLKLPGPLHAHNIRCHYRDLFSGANPIALVHEALL